jgi:type I restriction enzyme S subunit
MPEDIGISTTFAFDESHVLYGKLRPYLNKVALPDFPGRCTTEIIPLRPSDGLDRSFLCWLLRQEETIRAVMQEKTGTRMPRADMNVLLSQQVLLPPLPEQRRIAAILNEQMAAVEKARAAAKAQLEAAEALPAAYLRACFDPARSSWPKTPLGSIAEICSGVTLGRRIRGEPVRPVPYLRVANVKDGHLDLSDVKQTAASEEEISRLRLREGDVLFTEGGDPDKLGRGTFWQGQIEPCIHQNHIFRARFDLREFSPDFLAFQFGSDYGKTYFLKHAKQTTGIATINQKVLSQFPLMMPSLAEQQRIADAVNEELANVRRCRSDLDVQLAAIEALPRALMRQAFSGEL